MVGIKILGSGSLCILGQIDTRTDGEDNNLLEMGCMESSSYSL